MDSKREWVYLLFALVALVMSAMLIAPRGVTADHGMSDDGEWHHSGVAPCQTPEICADWYDFTAGEYLGSCCILPFDLMSPQDVACPEGVR